MQTPTPESGRPSEVVGHNQADDRAVNSSSPPPSVVPPDINDAPTVITSHRPRPADQAIADSLKGKKLGHFELIDAIGAGGMAAVLRAHDVQLGRTVALKILPPEMAADPDNVARFKNEARAAAKLDHENIARVFYCGEDQGLHFIAFEYVEGTDLRTLLARNGPLTPAQAVRFMLQIATGLAHAAERGVIHRDIKPSNVIVTPEGRAKIVDMGLARHTDTAGAVTQSGVTLGSFDYISPEQALEPRSADVRSDIYSLGCTFYHLLTGEPPVPEGTAAKKLHHHQQVEPIDPRELNPRIPDELAAILGRMMAKDPRRRYQRPEHLVQHLIQVAQKLQLSEGGGAETVLFMDAPLPQPPRFSPWVAAVLAVSAVALIAAVLGFVSTRRDPDGRSLPWSSRDDASNPPPWLAGAPGEPPARKVPEKKADVPVSPLVMLEPQNAETVQDLARLIEQRAEHIRLTGSVYDLSDLHAENPLKPAGFRIAGRRIKIEGVTGARAPVLRWSGTPGAARDLEPWAAFQLIGGDADMQAEFVHVRFECHSTEDDPPIYAVAARGLTQLRFQRCEFSHDRQADNLAGGIIRFEERPDKPSLLILDECLFRRGPNAIELTDRSQMKASQCAFGPHDRLFRIRPMAVRTVPSADWELVELRECTVMMLAGVVFQLERGTSGTLRAGGSVFARVLESADIHEAVLVQERDGRSAVVFAGLDDAAAPRNAYYNLAIWESGGRRAVRVADAQKEFRFADAGAVELTQRPWQNLQPVQLLDEKPLTAFALSTTNRWLRTQPRSRRMLGVQRGRWSDMYPEALEVLADDPVLPLVAKRIVQPAWPIDMALPPLTYRSLESAVGEAKPGDTIALQVNGPIELQPIRWSRTDDRPIVVRPDEGYRPVLTLHADVAESAAAMFTIAGGRLEFRDLQFRLLADPRRERDALTAATLTGSGQVSFVRCAFTLEESEGCHNAVVQIAGEADPASRAADRRPKVRFDSCFVRGKGDLIDVRPSRRFDLEADNSLIALDGTLVSILANPKENPPLASSITFNRVTGLVTDFWLDLRLSEEDRKAGGGIATTQCKVERSLLMAGNAKALVHSFGIDGDSLQRQYLAWEGRGNVYANFVQMVEVELSPNAMMMPSMPLSPKAWRTFTREAEEAFLDVKLVRPPTAERPLAKMQPNDFRVKPLDMRKMEAPGDIGANLGELPKADE